jgi:hypothetical protein
LTQVPPQQVWPDAHTLPQAAQLASVPSATQAPLHTTWSGGQPDAQRAGRNGGPSSWKHVPLQHWSSPVQVAKPSLQTQTPSRQSLP